MENKLISVDRWAQGSKAYFLTHLHSDHTNGLSSKWSHGPLFCSRITAKLLPYKFPDFNLSLIRIIQPGTSFTLSLPSPVHVTAIDACHCPGSLMLVFRGEFGCVICTGDFRWEAECERAKKAKEMLVEALNGEVVDAVYLDNTYCNPLYDFPSRRVATRQVIDIIASHPDHDVIISVTTLGKEELLHQISRELKTKIWVWPERLRTMHLLGYDDIFTTDTSITRVRAVPQYSFSIDTIEALNTMRPTIGIMPSGLPWVKQPLKKSEPVSDSFMTSSSKKGRWGSNDDEIQVDQQIGNMGSLEKIHKDLFTVPYSDHSNFAEIEDFIKLVRPIKLKGIVSSSSCYIEPVYYFGRLSHVKQPIQQLHNRKRKENGDGVEAVSTENSYGADTNELKRHRSKILKAKFSGIRVSRVSVLRRIRRGAKLMENNSSDED